MTCLWEEACDNLDVFVTNHLKKVYLTHHVILNALLTSFWWPNALTSSGTEVFITVQFGNFINRWLSYIRKMFEDDGGVHMTGNYSCSDLDQSACAWPGVFELARWWCTRINHDPLTYMKTRLWGLPGFDKNSFPINVPFWAPDETAGPWYPERTPPNIEVLFSIRLHCRPLSGP